MLYGAMKQNWNFPALWISIKSGSYIRRKKNETYAENKTLCLRLSMVVLGDALLLFCILWHWKTAVCGRHDGFIEVTGNPRRKRHATSDEAELNWRPLLMRNGLRFFRNAARSWCLVIHLVCSRS
jgi:hypothetical protein